MNESKKWSGDPGLGLKRGIDNPTGYEDLVELNTTDSPRWFDFLKTRIGDAFEFHSNKLGKINIKINDVVKNEKGVFVLLKNMDGKEEFIPIAVFANMLKSEIIKNKQ